MNRPTKFIFSSKLPACLITRLLAFGIVAIPIVALFSAAASNSPDVNHRVIERLDSTAVFRSLSTTHRTSALEKYLEPLPALGTCDTGNRSKWKQRLGQLGLLDMQILTAHRAELNY